MYTQCPNCSVVYSVRAEDLRRAMGMVRCTHCSTVFNSLSTLMDVSEDLRHKAEPLGEQVPFVALGDRVVIDSTLGQALVQQYRESVTQPRPGARRDVTSRPSEIAAEAAVQPKTVAQVRADTAPSPAHAVTPSPLKPATAADLPDRLTYTIAPEDSSPPRSLWTYLSANRYLAGMALALRNLLRHRRRTAFGLAAVGFGVVAMLLASGFIEWIYDYMRESTIRARLGHIQVAREGYLEAGAANPSGYVLSDDLPYLDVLERVPRVDVVARRLSFSGLIAHGETTVSFIGEGVEPEKESRVSTNLNIVAGEDLSSEAPSGIIMGAGLAENLGVGPGATVILLVTKPGAGISAVEAQVRGLFRTITKAYDDTVLRVPLPLARKLTGIAGTHLWVVLLDDTKYTDEVLNLLRIGLSQKTTKLEVTPWYELAEFYNQTVQLFSKQVNVVRFIIAIIVLVSISNTLIMTVLERTSEIGTLMAVGMRRRQVMRLFLQEGVLLGIVGGLLGVVVGYALARGISALGIPMPPPPGMAVGFIGAIRITWPLVFITLLVALTASVIASFYPAWKASRMVIVDALRTAR